MARDGRSSPRFRRAVVLAGIVAFLFWDDGRETLFSLARQLGQEVTSRIEAPETATEAAATEAAEPVQAVAPEPAPSVTTAAAAAAGAERAAAPAIEPRTEWNWQSVSSNPELLSEEIAQLVLALERNGALDWQTAAGSADGSVTTILRREKVLFGGIQQPLDALICRRNERVCTVEADGTSVWRLQSGKPVEIPNLTFREIGVPRTYHRKKSDQSISGILREQRWCKGPDPRCFSLVEKYNRAKLDKLEKKSGDIVVPTLALQTKLRLEPDLAQKIGAEIPGLERTIQVKHHAVEPFRSADDAALASIKCPEFGTPQFPSQGSSVVAIVEAHFDADHADLKGTPNVAVEPELRMDGIGLEGHGTYIAGLIGARKNAWGTLGINPRVHLTLLAYDQGLKKRTEVADHHLACLVDWSISGPSAGGCDDVLLPVAEAEGPDIFNFSLDYPRSGTQDELARKINGFRNHLFVASAGNSQRNLDERCDVLPACIGGGSRPNLIVVGAVDQRTSPAKLYETSDRRGSNFGNGTVHIAAPGSKLVGPIPGNKFGVASGTSQAAAIVSGAASLLYAKEKSAEAGRVIERLMSTVDFSTPLAGKIRSGVVNVGRALAFELDEIELEDGRKFRGRLQTTYGVSGKHELPVHEQFSASEQPQFIDLRRLLRVSRMKEPPARWVIALRSQDLANPAPEFHWKLVFNGIGDERLVFEAEGDNVTFHPMQIVEFVRGTGLT